MNSEIGARIGEARRTAGMTQEQLADLLGVSERSVQDYEGGKTIPWKHIRSIAALCQVEPDWLLHGERTDDRSMIFEILERVRRIEERLGALQGVPSEGSNRSAV